MEFGKVPSHHPDTPLHNYPAISLDAYSLLLNDISNEVQRVLRKMTMLEVAWERISVLCDELDDRNSTIETLQLEVDSGRAKLRLQESLIKKYQGKEHKWKEKS